MDEMGQNGAHPPAGEQDTHRPLWRRVVSAPEGKILAVGVAVLFWYITIVAFTWLYSPELCGKLAHMTLMHIVAGRAGGMTAGIQAGLPNGIIVVANMAIETFLVLLFYPLFVFSYQRLFVIPPLEETIRRAHEAAQAHQRTIMKFGIPGLLLFVWFPFWMTGPIVGCVIGFLIGLRPAVNLSVVLIGTYLAIFCWSLILQRFYDAIEPGPYVFFFIVAAILLVAVAIHVRFAFFHHRSSSGEAGGDDSAASP